MIIITYYTYNMQDKATDIDGLAQEECSSGQQFIGEDYDSDETTLEGISPSTSLELLPEPMDEPPESAHYSSAYNVKKDYEVDPYYSQNRVPQTKPSLKSDSHNTVNTPVGIMKPKRRKIKFDSRYEDNGHQLLVAISAAI